MDPFTEYLNILRQLRPEIRGILEAVRNQAGLVGTFNPREFAKLLGSALAIAEERALVTRALYLLTRLGVISPQILTGAIEFAAIAGVGAEEGAAGAGAAAAAGGVSVGLVLSVLTALLATGIAVYTITSEAKTELELPVGGAICGLNTPQGIEMATRERTVTVRAFGTRTSLNRAIKAAQEICELDSSKCTGTCAKGQKCLPNVAVQSSEQFFRFFFTTTVLKFTCPCTCKT
jgi:hypothetical protein